MCKVQSEGNVVYSDVYDVQGEGKGTVQLSIVGFGLKCLSEWVYGTAGDSTEMVTIGTA